MKSNYMNYFKDKKLYQWNKEKDIFMITNTEIDEEFCLDQKGMDMLLKFNNPQIKKGKTLSVTSGNVKAKIKLVEEQLVLPNMNFTSSYKINLDKLKIAKNFVSKAPNNRPILTGININEHSIVATDSFCAYRYQIENNFNITMIPMFIDLLAKFSGEIEIKANEQLAAFEIEDTIYIGRLLSGTYPPLDNAFKGNGVTTTLSKKELIEILTLSDDNKSYVNFKRNKITIEGETDIEIDINMDTDMDVWVERNKLLSIIKCVENEDVTIDYLGYCKPLKINNDFIILPIKKGA